jgi:predicted Zn-dependent peptidase
MKEEISALGRVLLTDEELDATKISLKSDQVRSLQSIGAQAGVSDLDELLGLGYKNYLDYPLRIDAVTKEDVQRVSVKYFDLNRMVVVETLPEKNAKNAGQ